jgi:hypothetical protein
MIRMHSRVDHLIEQYAAAWNAGRPDPMPFLEEVSGPEREALEKRIDLFLMTAPPRKWDADEFATSRAAEITDRLVEASRCPSGAWPEVLPALMSENRLLREQVVAELAGEIGAESPDEIEQVGDYFHRMTWGTLDSSGVSDRVLEALGRILKTSAGALREAGMSLGAKFPGTEDEGIVYARTPTDPGQTVEYGIPEDVESGAGHGSERIARLFTGGPSAGDGD